MKDPILPLFSRQHGVVHRRQALAAGLSHHQIRWRVAAGVWSEVAPGVYRPAARPVTPEMTIMAAALCAGPAAVVSHQAAAYLWGLLDWRECGERAAVTVPAPRHPRAPGFDLHRTAHLPWERVRRWKGFDCTDPLWTLFDLAGAVPVPAIDDAIDRALASRLVTVAGLEAEVGRRTRKGRAGGGALRQRLMQRGYIGAPSPSVLESRALRFLRQYGLPVERAELRTGPDGEYRIDFSLEPPVMWEVDGYVWHFSPEHAARDQDRRNQLLLAGFDLYVSNWLTLQREPGRLAVTLHRAISSARARATASSTTG